MARQSSRTRSSDLIDAIARSLKRHSILSRQDEAALEELEPGTKSLTRGTEFVSQGEQPDASVFVLRGMVGRYHTTQSGNRQYLSLHIAGDFPDLQSLFLQEMDHSLAALDEGEIALIPHEQLKALIVKAPNVATALWRQTLLDAAIFRQAITTNGALTAVQRVAHLFCEQYTRARANDLAEGDTCSLPLSQTQIGQMLGLSIVTVNRALQSLRKSGSAELRGGKLTVRDWSRLQQRASFDRCYLHIELCAEPMATPRGRARTPKRS